MLTLDPVRRRLRTRLLPVLLALAAFGLAGCVRLLPTPTPLRTIRYAQGGDRSRCLVVLLHGRGGSAADFADNHFQEDAARAGVAADFVAVEANLGYYYRHTILDRLREDVIGPARAHGYRRIWIAGVSIGGTGAILYAREHPGDLAGIVAIAPYLGEKPVVDEIAGPGLRAWQPSGPPESDTFEHSVWRYLKRFAEGPPPLPLYLGYGRKDRFARADALLAGVLPRERVFLTDGGHDWKPWRRMWDQFLATGTLARTEQDAGSMLGCTTM
jgi:pimeloyl-ACP methyl ester carboxylesterase